MLQARFGLPAQPFQQFNTGARSATQGQAKRETGTGSGKREPLWPLLRTQLRPDFSSHLLWVGRAGEADKGPVGLRSSARVFESSIPD